MKEILFPLDDEYLVSHTMQEVRELLARWADWNGVQVVVKKPYLQMIVEPAEPFERKEQIISCPWGEVDLELVVRLAELNQCQVHYMTQSNVNIYAEPGDTFPSLIKKELAADQKLIDEGSLMTPNFEEMPFEDLQVRSAEAIRGSTT